MKPGNKKGKQMKTAMSLYLVEYYTKNPATGETGYEIRFAWIGATDKAEAKRKAEKLPFFDVVIMAEEQAQIFKLSGIDPVEVKHIDDDEWRKTKSGVWADIAGKAFMYKTAKLDGEFVALVSVVAPGTFAIQHRTKGLIAADCHTLTDYCL